MKKEAAESVLAFEDKKKPDWYNESAATIEPALTVRKKSYSNWLASDDRKFAECTHTDLHASRTFREANNTLFTAKAEEAQCDIFSGKRIWQSIWDMQRSK